MQDYGHHQQTYIPWATLALAIILPVLTYGVHRLPTLAAYDVSLLFGAVPAEITSGQHLWSLITSGLVHLSQEHLVSNLLILGIAGVYFERRVGVRLTLGIIVAGVMGGSLAHALTYPDSEIPLYGISGGAIALASAALVYAVMIKAPQGVHLWIKGIFTLGATLILIVNLLPAMAGGIAMPQTLVESGVAHWIGIGVGVLLACWWGAVLSQVALEHEKR